MYFWDLSSCRCSASWSSFLPCSLLAIHPQYIKHYSFPSVILLARIDIFRASGYKCFFFFLVFQDIFKILLEQQRSNDIYSVASIHHTTEQTKETSIISNAGLGLFMGPREGLYIVGNFWPACSVLNPDPYFVVRVHVTFDRGIWVFVTVNYL